MKDRYEKRWMNVKARRRKAERGSGERGKAERGSGENSQDSERKKRDKGRI